MIDQIGRFKRWREKLAPDTFYFVSKVCDEVLPIIIDAGYTRLHNYGGDKARYAALGRCIALQFQSGEEWPTIEFRFTDLGRPTLVVDFAWLPEVCLRWEKTDWVQIPRPDGFVSEGYVFFRLMRNQRRGNDGMFGISRLWPHFRPRVAIDREIDVLKGLLDWLLETLSRGMPEEWGPTAMGRHVHAHALLQWGAIALNQRKKTTLE
jgi:hypothetical protein